MEGSNADSKGTDNGNDTSVTYNASYGKFGQGALFNGASSIIINENTVLNPQYFSLSCWVNLAASQTSREFYTKYNNTPSERGIGLGISDGNTNKIKFYMCDTVNANTLESSATLSNNTWYHVVFVYDGTKQYIYINGSLDNSVAWTHDALYTSTSASIGCLGNKLGQYFNGYIDDMALFSRALSSTEISNLYLGNFPGFSPSASLSPSASISASLSPSSSASASLSPSSSRSPSASFSPSSSISSSLSPSSSRSPSSSLSPSSSASPSIGSPSASLSPSSSISASLSPSASPSLSYTDYSRGAYTVLPTNDNDLSTIYTEAEVEKTMRESDQYPDVEDDIDQEGVLQYMIHQFKAFVGSVYTFGIDFSGESSLAPSSSPVHLQIFNQVTHLWETLDSNDLYSAEVTFELKVRRMLAANYVKNNLISCRVWQLAI